MILFSKYFKKIDLKNGYYALFNSLVREVFFCDVKQLRKIELGNIDIDCQRELEQAGIIIKDFSDDKLLLERYKCALENEHTNITLVYVIPTLVCNLKCDYCYVFNNKDIYIQKVMTKEVVDVFLEKYVAYLLLKNIKDATIQFYGGEPCCNWDIVEYCIGSAKKLYPFNFIIITNSTLLDESKIKFVKENNIGIGISIDGTKEITDLHRKFINGNGSVYDNVLNKIELLKKEKINIALSVTITNEFLNFQEDMLNMFENIGVQNINYNLLHSHDKIEGLDLYYNNATEFIISSYERLYKKGIMDDRILRKINAFVNDIFYYADCGAAYANQIVLKPDGTIGICQCECSTNNHEIGNIIFDDFSVVCNNKNRLKWKYKLPIYNEYCLDCEAISICGGGCIVQADEIGCTNNIRDTYFCIHTKKLFFWLLQKLYDIS